jgi:hypothetical protein
VGWDFRRLYFDRSLGVKCIDNVVKELPEFLVNEWSVEDGFVFIEVEMCRPPFASTTVVLKEVLALPHIVH